MTSCSSTPASLSRDRVENEVDPLERAARDANVVPTRAVIEVVVRSEGVLAGGQIEPVSAALVGDRASNLPVVLALRQDRRVGKYLLRPPGYDLTLDPGFLVCAGFELIGILNFDRFSTRPASGSLRSLCPPRPRPCPPPISGLGMYSMMTSSTSPRPSFSSSSSAGSRRPA